MFINKLLSVYSIDKSYNDRVYHNAKLLLELYSKVLWRMGESLNELDAECYDTDNKHLFDLINSLIDVDTQIDKIRFECRMQSIEESKSLIELVDKSLAKLKTYPENGELYFQILSKVYIVNSSIKLSEEELLETLHISRSTLYREKKNAITMFGVILWGFALHDIINGVKNETLMTLK